MTVILKDHYPTLRLIIYTALLSLIYTNTLFAQAGIAKGFLTDSEDNSGIEGGIVQLFSPDGKESYGYALTGADGAFVIKHAHFGNAILSASSLGYKSKKVDIDLNQGVTANVLVTLEAEATLLKEVSVKSHLVVRRTDTVSYVVESMKLETDRNIEDLIKRIPGISVDEKGTISYGGIPISRVYIDGMDMRKEKYALATQSIHPDDVGSVSIYERHEPVKVLQGETRPESAALNLSIKEGSRMRPIGYIYGAGGSGRRPVLFDADLFGLLVRSDSQYLVAGKANNDGTHYRDLIRTSDFPDNPLELLSETEPLGASPAGIPLEHFRENGDWMPTYNSIHKTDNGDIFTKSTLTFLAAPDIMSGRKLQVSLWEKIGK